MIWTTAKSTDVNSRHSSRPSRASGFVGAPALVAARTAAGVAMIGLLDGRGRRLGRAGGGETRRQVVLQVLEILQTDRHA